MTNSAYLFGLHLALKCFSPTEQLSRTLKTQTTYNCKIPDTDNAFDDFYEKVVEESKDLTDAPLLAWQQKHNANLDAGEHAHSEPSGSLHDLMVNWNGVLSTETCMWPLAWSA